MADTTVLAIVIPGGVSALAIAGNVYVSRSSAQHAQRLADKEAARTLLDEAAQLLHEVGYAIDDALDKYLTLAEDFRAEADKGEGAFREIEKLGHEIDRMVVRLETRVGPDHTAAKHFREANKAVLNIYGRISTTPTGGRRLQTLGRAGR